MASYHEELLSTARHLLERQAGQRGLLPGARVRRSKSTAYYALFHFLLDELGRSIVGATPALRWRRRVVARTVSHKGMLTALNKVKGRAVNESVAAIFSRNDARTLPAPTPRFAQGIAVAFADAQAQRVSADYDLDAEASGADARLLLQAVEDAIAAWQNATTPAARTFKGGLAILMLLGGRLRNEE